MIRSCCLQRSDYTVSQMFKKKNQPTASLYLNYSSSTIVCQSLYKAEWKYCPPVSLSLRDLVKLTLNVLKETLSKITDDFKLLWSMGVWVAWGSAHKLDKQGTLVLPAQIHIIGQWSFYSFKERLSLIGRSACLNTTVSLFPNTSLLSITVLNVNCF